MAKGVGPQFISQYRKKKNKNKNKKKNFKLGSSGSHL
jgi:hypothetical protein